MRFKVFLIILLFAGTILHSSCSKKKQPELTSLDITKVINKVTLGMVHDVTNPPLAARFFVYTCLAGYEVVSENDKSVKGMHGVLNEYPDIKKPAFANGYDYRLSALVAMMETAGKMQPTGSSMIKYEQELLDSCRRIGFSDEVIDSSKHYGQAISKQILAYAKKDKYNRISNYKRFSPAGADSTWDPTPPAYMAPVEPYFNTVRPLTIKSSTQFLPGPPIPFSTDKNSAFYKFLIMNYKASGNALTMEQKTIANFWDCNPFALQDNGHMLIGLKKISPGAHWMGITGIACAQAKANFSKAMEVHTVVAAGLLDAFISCWEDKYRTNRIRPETAIRRYIDINWKPLLQTPPFPEYISGHSIVSATSAVILTHYFGDNFQYTDNVEVGYGVPARHFSSFMQAAKEAAISRFWGGIHFMDAIDNGVTQGVKIGNWVVDKVSAPKKSS
ncbi:vanadium-dependent haloperoxidase [Mucilaginibacter xinganensis]|uniref:Haloperoxidase n=1 Tax=Mucilaginibacter xinganensis TaxID=1234841 RepID=A0A223NV32_9SPHI|nr:vanadium-dependent haloperoxidase [Mucilaginibacter xinganensis]ASU33534.1 haloperoxidase [Mucilaginibacter xinganensis]